MDMRSVLPRAASTAAALLLGFAGTAVAATPPGPPPNPVGELTVSSPGTRAVQDTVTCTFYASKPNYSGGRITGTGGISSCSPHAPYACNSEVDLEVYLVGPRVWQTVAASNRQYSCPPPLRSTTAAMSCSSTSISYSYRTKTLGTVVYGTTSSGTWDSAVLSVQCF